LKEYDGYIHKEFSELSGKDVDNDKLLLKGIIMGIGDIEHYVTFAVTKCSGCKDELQYMIDEFPNWRHFFIPKVCVKCGDTLIVKQTDMGTVRKILFGEEKASNPITFTAYVFGDQVYDVKPGERIRVNCVMRSVKVGKTDVTYKRVIDIIRMTLESAKIILPTPEEIEEFNKMDKKKLIDSFAPRIKNMLLIKEGLLIGLLGGVDDGQTRGDINVLLMGDPGVAKTQLLKFIASIIQKSDYTSGKSSSQAGLLAGVDNLADGTRIAKPGSVIMCNGGICCIDEFEKMNPQDRAGLHEVMENQTFSLRKIGINMTWEAKTTIFAAANPRSSRWDMSITINQNLNMPESLMSRFGLLFLIRDIPNEENDLEVARHIRKIKQGTMEECLSEQTLTKFINYARTLSPKVTDEVADCIQQYWCKLRCVPQKDGSVQIDNRKLQDLYRMAEAYARMDLSNIVELSHGQSAITLLGNSLKTMNMNTPGEVTASIMKHINKEEFLMHIFKDGISENSAMLKMGEYKNWYATAESSKREIFKLKNRGLIYDNGGLLRWV
jgi:replicative DNA helicase Mcm